MAVRVAIIGHVVPTPARVDLPRGGDEIRSLLQEFDYTRVIRQVPNLVGRDSSGRGGPGRPPVATDIMNDLRAKEGVMGLLSAAYFYPHALMQMPAGVLAEMGREADDRSVLPGRGVRVNHVCMGGFSGERIGR